MDASKNLYRTALNPLLIEPSRPLPDEIAVIGAGTIGPGYRLLFEKRLARKQTLPGGCPRKVPRASRTAYRGLY